MLFGGPHYGEAGAIDGKVKEKGIGMQNSWEDGRFVRFDWTPPGEKVLTCYYFSLINKTKLVLSKVGKNTKHNIYLDFLFLAQNYLKVQADTDPRIKKQT